MPPGFSGMLSLRSSSPGRRVDIAIAELGALTNGRSLSSIECTRVRALERDRRMAPLRIDTAPDSAGQ